MGLFSKKEKKPEISPSPVLPELPPKGEANNKRSSGLPAFPENKNNANLNQEMIKSAMSDESAQGNEGEEELETRIPNPPALKTPQRGKPQRDTIFVKIDKFNSSKESLSTIQEKVQELSGELQGLKEIKLKESKEISAWDDELKKINQRLSRIDSNIFGEV